MEDKYLYTIAIIVIFAGFLFTSVGSYTGRPVVEIAPTLSPDYSSSPRSSATEGFMGQPKSVVKSVRGATASTCTISEEGFQQVVVEFDDREYAGVYRVCSSGDWVKQVCDRGLRVYPEGDAIIPTVRCV